MIDARDSLNSAIEVFLSIVYIVSLSQLSAMALGSWTLRELIVHANRALTPIESYCNRGIDGTTVSGPAHYFVLIGEVKFGSAGRLERDALIADRGREGVLVLEIILRLQFGRLRIGWCP